MLERSFHFPMPPVAEPVGCAEPKNVGYYIGRSELEKKIQGVNAVQFGIWFFCGYFSTVTHFDILPWEKTSVLGWSALILFTIFL